MAVYKEGILLQLFVLSMSLSQCSPQVFSVMPVNTALRTGTDLKWWQCGVPSDTNNPIFTWVEFISNEETGQTIVIGDGDISHPNPDKYDIYRFEENNVLHYDLGVLNVNSADAGRYKCGTYTPVNNDAFAYLITVETALQCEDNRPAEVEEGDTIYFACKVDYTGLWAPRLEWWLASSPVDNVVNETEDGNAQYSHTLTVRPSDNGVRFDCRLQFDAPPEGSIPDDSNVIWYNRDAPSYTDACSVDMLNVLYSARNVTISPRQGEFYPDDMITCEGVGNPAVEYRWIDLDTLEEISTSPTITITAEMEGDRNFMCVVWNEFKNQERNMTEILSFTVMIPTTTTPPPTTTTTMPSTDGPGPETTETPGGGLSEGAIAGIAVGCSLAIIIIIILLVCLCRRKKSKDPGPPPSKPNHNDMIRHPSPVGGGHPAHMDYPANIDYNNEKPPPYDAGPPLDHMDGNPENLNYASLALDDTPRSRKPIQVYEPTEYADIRRV